MQGPPSLSTLLYYTLYSTLYSALLYSTLLYSILYSTLYSTLLYSTLLYSHLSEGLCRPPTPASSPFCPSAACFRQAHEVTLE